MRTRTRARQRVAAGLASHSSLSTQTSIAARATGCDTGRLASSAVRNAHQRQEVPTLPTEMLEHILSYVDKSSWPDLYRTCKQWHDWVATQAAAGWSKQVQTRLLWIRDSGWWWPTKYYSGPWHEVEHAHTPTYMTVDSEKLLQSIQRGNADADVNRLRDTISKSFWRDLQLHVYAPSHDPTNTQGPQLVYVQSWLAFLLNPQQTSPAVAACFSLITTIQLQDVRLTHPLPECIRQVCTSLHSYSLQDVVWPEQVAPGKPWPQLQQLSYGSSTAASSTGFMTAQLPQLINLTTLPGLHSLYLTSWPEHTSAGSLVGCCAAFCDQLTNLFLGKNAALGAILSGPCLSRTPSTPILPQLTELEVGYQMGDDNLDALLAAAPALQHLKVQTLQVLSSRANIQCQLTRLKVESMPDFVATLAGLPQMPKLEHLSLPTLTVQGRPPTEQQVAAAVTVMEHLSRVEGFLLVNFQFAGPARAAYMQPIGPLMQALCHKSIIPEMLFECVDRYTLEALGAAAVPHVAFKWCDWNPPHLLSQVWALMPHTSKVTYQTYGKQQPFRGYEETLLLCRSATRPVTVYLDQDREEWREVYDTLATEGNQWVSLCSMY